MPLDLNADLTLEQRDLIERHLSFYRSLDTEDRAPSTAAQKHFVAVCRGQAKAETTHEEAYVKFRILRAKQLAGAKDESSSNEEFGEGVPKPGWFTDEGWKRMRGQYLSNSG